MAVLGVLTCEVLELEFAALLASDRSCTPVTVVADERSTRLVEALEARGCPDLRRVAQPDRFVPGTSEGCEVLVRVLELGLHARRKRLQEGLVEAAREMSPYVDGIFLGYGLCGNALEKPRELLADAGVPVYLPMDEDHPVDDCVGLVLGGRRAYYEEQCRVAGTFFMTPGWTVHWKRIFDKEFGSISVEMAQRLFARYERSLLVTTPLMGEEQMRANAGEFNHLFDCRFETRRGTLSLLERSWAQAVADLQAGAG
ncbi:MAG: DUF1638 domain-containing protein [Deferrisomatales bacterium]